MGTTVRAATPADVPEILRFIRALADYEHLAHMVVASEEKLRATLFGARPAAEVLLAELDGRGAGFALYFHSYSTFLAQPGIFLEDLFVDPAARKHGVGRALLSRLAQVTIERGCARLEWAALDWNRLAIDFYLGLGAESMSEWTTFRMTGDSLRTLANG